MPVFKLFSERRREALGQVVDVYQYEELPQALRVQIVHILNDALGDPEKILNKKMFDLYKYISKSVAREHGEFALGPGIDSCADVKNFILQEKDLGKVFDAIEFSFKIIDRIVRDDFGYSRDAKLSMEADAAIEELNTRFKKAGVGYQYVNEMIIRVDSEFLHMEATIPALNLLRRDMYKGANAEFRKAFEDYKDGDYKGSLVSALRSLESTLKSICTKRKWAFSPTDTASKLINNVLQNGLVPVYMQGHFDSLRSLLESVATPRNKMGGHGQGVDVVQVPEYFARFALNVTASAIHLLASAEESLP